MTATAIPFHYNWVRSLGCVIPITATAVPFYYSLHQQQCILCSPHSTAGKLENWWVCDASSRVLRECTYRLVKLFVARDWYLQGRMCPSRVQLLSDS